jgi:small-conductance mechanosensitive channel
VLPNPWFTRMTPVRTLDLVLWPLTSIIVGVLLATAVLPRTGERQRDLSLGIGCGVLSAFAVGCPVCLVVLALGFAGALTYFAHVQPVLGVAALALSTLALKQRLRALAAGARPGARVEARQHPPSRLAKRWPRSGLGTSHRAPGGPGCRPGEPRTVGSRRTVDTGSGRHRPPLTNDGEGPGGLMTLVVAS